MATPPTPDLPSEPTPAATARSKWVVLGTIVVLMAGLFFIDVQTPVGVADWLLYFAVVLLALSVPGRWHVIAVAAGCSVLTAIGLYLSPPGGNLERAAVNRSLAVVTFWLTAVGGLALRRTAALEKANAQLVREVEERRKAEQRVGEQASLLDIAQDAISVRDLDDRITYWNRGAERLYGRSAAEVLGKSATELLDRTPPAELAAARAALLRGGVWSGEARHVTRDGRELLVETRWTLVRDDAGRPRARLVVSTDVTQRRRLEAQVLRTQRLESVGVLAGGLAHDFNNLLTPMLMSVKLLREDRPADERAELVDTLQAGAERGAELVRKLLAFAGGADGSRGPVAVRTVVKEIRSIVTHTFPKSIDLEVRLADDLRPVTADPTQLSQVLMNLCVNARDAMPGGGTLAITAENVTVGPGEPGLHPDARPGEYVRLTVADTGTGIDPSVLDRIFDPFFTTKGTGRGTGLGLATVQGIVHGHDGFVTVASTPGSGSRFDAYWPAVAEVRPADLTTTPPPPPAAPVPAGDRPLVLVVDDEGPILHTARVALEADGYRVATARDGRAALDLYRQHREDVRAVVLDVMMPGMDGAATLAELSRLDPGCRVLLTSGLRLTGPLADAARAGRVGFLPKPYTADQLLAALARVPQPA
jgi:PAS domain S-box-containing protein